MKRILIKIAYDGTEYHGFQKQINSKTIQGTIENILSSIIKKEIKTIGSSRTDAGVHSLSTLLVFDTDFNVEAIKWKYILNSKLPKDIVVIESKEVDLDYNPLRNKYIKTYKYYIDYGEYKNPLKEKTHVYIDYKLNIEDMKKAAKEFIGKKDFITFSASKREYLTSIRTIFESRIDVIDDDIVYTVTGDGFLYNMVRIIVGTLIEVGENKISYNEINDIILAKNRNNAGKTMPAKGLVLYKTVDCN